MFMSLSTLKKSFKVQKNLDKFPYWHQQTCEMQKSMINSFYKKVCSQENVNERHDTF